MQMTAEQQHALRDIFARNHVAVAYLYGSVARGTAGKQSDVDIAVMFRDSLPAEEHQQQEGRLILDLEKLLQRPVELVNLAQATSPLLRHRAVLRGKLLYCADRRLKQRVEREALREYEDTAFLRALHGQSIRRHSVDGSFGAV